ncbi:Transmembrane protein [Quillaja saponaria]|uniref:Transmembrane protein n=1 Tax=Quillaja saponaria TaxID=32244 RepID=A0AAD7M4N7_QUISA|nr:Transmembrane protein [Quillaja saponaria]
MENFVNAKNGGMALILGTICIAWFYMSRNWKSKQRKILTRSKSIGLLHGGEPALQRLVDFNEASTNPATLDNAKIVLKALLTEEHLDFRKLQSTGAKLEMSGNEAEAVQPLKNAVKKFRKEGKLHEAYEIEMILVETLIYKGDSEQALGCECLKDEDIYDARRPLYKAIIHIMRGDPEREAKECWKEFNNTRGHPTEFSSSAEDPNKPVDSGHRQWKKKMNLPFFDMPYLKELSDDPPRGFEGNQKSDHISSYRDKVMGGLGRKEDLVNSVGKNAPDRADFGPWMMETQKGRRQKIARDMSTHAVNEEGSKTGVPNAGKPKSMTYGSRFTVLNVDNDRMADAQP